MHNGQGAERNANNLGKFILKLALPQESYSNETEKLLWARMVEKCLKVKNKSIPCSKYKSQHLNYSCISQKFSDRYCTTEDGLP